MADENAENQMENLNKMKVVEIKKLLKAQGLSTNGNKSELIQRLKASNDTSDSLLEMTVTIDSEVFDEDLDEDLDEVELMSDEKEDMDKQTSHHGKKLKAEESATATKEADQKGSGKVSSSEHNKQLSKLLDEEEVMMEEDEDTKNLAGDDKMEGKQCRADSSEMQKEDKDKDHHHDQGKKTDKMESSAQKGTAPSDKQSHSSSAARKLIKITHMSNREKLVKRAEKFGLTEAAKKELRAARFGIQTKASMDELLKKRAERFGLHPTMITNTSTRLSLSSEGDVLKKRAQRFGITPAQSDSAKVETSRKMVSIGSVQQGTFRGNTLDSKTPEERKVMRSLRFKVAT